MPCADPRTALERHSAEKMNGDICRGTADPNFWVCPKVCELSARKKG